MFSAGFLIGDASYFNRSGIGQHDAEVDLNTAVEPEESGSGYSDFQFAEAPIDYFDEAYNLIPVNNLYRDAEASAESELRRVQGVYDRVGGRMRPEDVNRAENLLALCRRMLGEGDIEGVQETLLLSSVILAPMYILDGISERQRAISQHYTEEGARIVREAMRPDDEDEGDSGGYVRRAGDLFQSADSHYLRALSFYEEGSDLSVVLDEYREAETQFGEGMAVYQNGYEGELESGIREFLESRGGGEPTEEQQVRISALESYLSGNWQPQSLGDVAVLLERSQASRDLSRIIDVADDVRRSRDESSGAEISSALRAGVLPLGFTCQRALGLRQGFESYEDAVLGRSDLDELGRYDLDRLLLRLHALRGNFESGNLDSAEVARELASVVGDGSEIHPAIEEALLEAEFLPIMGNGIYRGGRSFVAHTFIPFYSSYDEIERTGDVSLSTYGMDLAEIGLTMIGVRCLGRRMLGVVGSFAEGANIAVQTRGALRVGEVLNVLREARLGSEALAIPEGTGRIARFLARNRAVRFLDGASTVYGMAGVYAMPPLMGLRAYEARERGDDLEFWLSIGGAIFAGIIAGGITCGLFSGTVGVNSRYWRYLLADEETLQSRIVEVMQRLHAGLSGRRVAFSEAQWAAQESAWQRGMLDNINELRALLNIARRRGLSGTSDYDFMDASLRAMRSEVRSGVSAGASRVAVSSERASIIPVEASLVRVRNGPTEAGGLRVGAGQMVADRLVVTSAEAAGEWVVEGTEVVISELMQTSRVGFGTSGARGLVDRMTDRVCYAYARAFAAHLVELGEIRAGDTVVIAGDLRPSTPRIMQAVARALVDAGYRVENAGRIPSPALCSYGMRTGRPTIMVTGSHIPHDRNGIKFGMTSGEISKQDEDGIRGQNVTVPGIFDEGGRFIEERDLLGDPRTDAEEMYVARYVDFFGRGALSGLRIGVYQHSAVGRDLMVRILRELGAEVIPFGRSDEFMPVDTEAISEDFAALMRNFTHENDIDAIISEDGDGDRPVVTDASGRIIRGDVAGILTAQFLGASHVVTPVSSNTAVDGLFVVARTRIGSPYVIAGMEAQARTPGSRVAGYEANGGFMTASPFERGGRVLESLPTRDPIIVHLAILAQARSRGVPVSQLVAELPPRFTASNRIQNFPTDVSQDIVRQLRSDQNIVIRVFSRFGRVVEVDNTDGIRMIFKSGDIIHLRPSGNAPELRVYTESSTTERAEELNQQVLSMMSGWREGLRVDVVQEPALGADQMMAASRSDGSEVSVSADAAAERVVAGGRDVYPLVLRPHLVSTVWGGRNIAPSDPRPIGESWLASAATGKGAVSIVTNGSWEGCNLTTLAERQGIGFLGEDVVRRFGRRFPVLLKDIDAAQDLSVQVHPDAAVAESLGGGTQSKSETWLILSAEPGARIAFGLEPWVTREIFEQMIGEGRVEEALRFVEVHPGEVYPVRPGIVHAIGRGVRLAELQETSDTTFRVYDYGRLGLDGRPRELHIDQALQAIRFGEVPQPAIPVRLPGSGERFRLDVEPGGAFEMQRWEFTEPAGLAADGQRFWVIAPLDQRGVVIESRSEHPYVVVRYGSAAVIPAILDVRLVPPELGANIFLGTVPLM